jgi:hypothetical protein
MTGFFVTAEPATGVISPGAMSGGPAASITWTQVFERDDEPSVER